MRSRHSRRRGLRVLAEHPDLAGAALAIALEDLDRGRLAGAVGPEEGEDLAGLDLEVDAANGLDSAVGLAQPGRVDRGVRAFERDEVSECRAQSSSTSRCTTRSTQVVAPGEVAGDPVGDRHRAVAAAGAADRERHVALALGDVGGQQEVEQREDAARRTRSPARPPRRARRPAGRAR